MDSASGQEAEEDGDEDFDLGPAATTQRTTGSWIFQPGPSKLDETSFQLFKQFIEKKISEKPKEE